MGVIVERVAQNIRNTIDLVGKASSIDDALQ